MSDRDAFLKDLADSRLRLKKWRTERAGKDGSTLLSDALTVLDTLERSIRAGGSSVETANLGFQLGYLVGHAKGAEYLADIRSRAKSAANLTPRKPTVTDKAIAVALKRYHTKKDAAGSLGITDRALRNRTPKRK
jgi:hypothetical protein